MVIKEAFVCDNDVALWLVGAAFALVLPGLLGAFRSAKRLESLRLQFPAQR